MGSDYTCSNADGEAEGSFTFTRTWTVTATDDVDNSNSQQPLSLYCGGIDWLRPGYSEHGLKTMHD